MVRHNPFWTFKSWCESRINILHRLKYVTNTIIEVLEREEYQPSLVSIKSSAYKKLLVGSGIFNQYEQKVVLENFEREATSNDHRSQSNIASYAKPDQFLPPRELDKEFVEVLQCFDLQQYGIALALLLLSQIEATEEIAYVIISFKCFLNL